MRFRAKAMPDPLSRLSAGLPVGEAGVPVPAAVFHVLGWGQLFALLFIFFLISSSGAGMRGVSVEVPRVFGGEAFEGALCVVVDKNNLVYFDAKKIQANELDRVLSAQCRAGKKELLIKADRRSDIEALAGVWDAARRAGVEKVYVASGE